ncbi:MAG: suppressor of fused domain protein [Oscillospiraceae bacterium]|nr:suppressor of fused domain protein [Oscillospiraceae bacterium]
MGIFDAFKKKEQPKPQSEREGTHEVILKSRSLVCDVEAFVEKSDTCYYFYLWFKPMHPEAKMRTCWICNRKPAPKKIDVDSMTGGRAPMMPAEFVAHPIGGMELDETSLSVVWFEEGTGAALLSGEEILCVIPEWSGYKDFHGYAKYAKGTGPFAWEIVQALPHLNDRVEMGRKLWNFFQGEGRERVWMMAQREEILKFIGTHENDFDITLRQNQGPNDPTFPPKVVVSGSRDGVIYGVTAGVSTAAMPMVDFHVDGDPREVKRMELGFATIERHRPLCRPMYGTLCSFANFPWDQLTFLAHGHTIPFRNIGGFAAMLFVNPRFVEGLESPSCTRFLDGSAVNVLWTVPITQEEYDFAVQNSSQELLKKAADASHIHIFDGKPKFVL